MSDEQTTKRGGARPGAGRKPIHADPMVNTSLRLPPRVSDAVNADREGAREVLTRWARTKGASEVLTRWARSKGGFK